MEKIYLAIPYTGLQELSFKTANKVAAKLMRKGKAVYSPISHSHTIALQEDLPTTWEWWMKIDIEFIQWCDVLYVVTLPGWDKSPGVAEEIEIATRLNKPIIYYVLEKS